MLWASVLTAQQSTVTGTVTSSEDGSGLPGVNVMIKDSSIGTVTDLDGRYSLRVPTPDDILVFSSVGFLTQEIAVNGRSVINIVMDPDVKALDEVVVIGYGSVKKSDLTGAVSSVSSDDITKIGTISLENALAGRAPGVSVTQNSGVPGSGTSIKIRGANSMTGSDPLFVIDGVALDNSPIGNIVDSSEPARNISPLSMINPRDIVSIEILKDASATAIYGSRGANGVILVTTKQGRDGKGIVSLDVDIGVSEVGEYIDVLDANNFVLIREEAYTNAGISTDIRETYLDSAKNNLIPTSNWQDAIYRQGLTEDYNIGFQGGNKDLDYLLSVNYLNVKGVILESDFNRFTTRLNLNANLNPWLKVGTRLTISGIRSNEVNTASSYHFDRGQNSVVMRALIAAPTQSPYTEDGEIYAGEDGVVNYSPLVAIEANDYSNETFSAIGNLYATIKLAKHLRFRTSVSSQYRLTDLRFYQTADLPDAVTREGWARTSDRKVKLWQVDNTLTYDRSFSEHHINAMVGMDMQNFETEVINTSNYGFPNDILTYYGMNIAEFNDPDFATYADSKLLSFFGRINYTFKDKYLVTFTGRSDGSSKFAANNKWAFFPAGALAYRLSSEPFMDNVEVISNAKVRASYGVSGNQALSPYQSLAQLSGNLIGMGSGTGTEQLVPVYYTSQLPNENLKWEPTKQLDIGLDLGLFEDRLSFVFDYYKKNTEDLLVVGFRVSAISGFNSATVNLGEMETRGVELGINAVIMDQEGFRWDASLNLSNAKTKIIDMGTDYIPSGYNQGWLGNGSQILIIGEELGTFWGYKRTRISQFEDFAEFYDDQGNLKPEQELVEMYNANPSKRDYTPVAEDYPSNLAARPGEQLYEDTNDDNVINDSDKQVIGHAQPEVVLGFRNEFRYRNFDLTIFVDGKYGNDIANINNLWLMGFNTNQQLTKVIDRWTPEASSEIYPRVSSENTGGSSFIFSDLFIEDGSYTRIQNITLGYTFNEKVLSRIKMNRLRIYAAVTNLYTFTNYSGYTPDVSIAGQDNLRMGHDSFLYPLPTTYRLGLNIGF
jgi:TonB-linked SusC/RagA family outer membrane protein